MTKKHNFSGYATKAGLECSDGLTIMPEAFKEMDGQTVPLVWQHGHGDPKNVLGHAVLEARDDGVYAYGFFNKTPGAETVQELVEHDDIKALSIYANKLVQKSKQVFHGVIREVSLVLSGANPGAKIDFVGIAHGDGSVDYLDDEAIIYTGLELDHDEDGVGHADGDGDGEGQTIKDILDGLSSEQMDAVTYMIGAALESRGSAKQSSIDNEEEDLSHKEGTQEMNVFEDKKSSEGRPTHELSHEDVQGIVADAIKGGSLREAVEDYAIEHGIDDIETLFPEAKLVNGAAPEWVTRRMEWVSGVLNGTTKTPFSRIKTRQADITHDDARAKGYIKGTMKKEQFFGLMQRVTTPTTVYKKQQLDRDDMIDITDFDVVAWIKAEMRVMLDEELARAILIGDGREVSDEDKIKDPAGANEGAGIRSILHDHHLYATRVTINMEDANSDYEEVVEAVMRARRFYKGSGSPTFYTTAQVVVEMLLTKDNDNRRMWGDGPV